MFPIGIEHHHAISLRQREIDFCISYTSRDHTPTTRLDSSCTEHEILIFLYFEGATAQVLDNRPIRRHYWLIMFLPLRKGSRS